MIAISYRREDSLPVAGRLYDRLKAEWGPDRVFMDFDSIPYGVDFREHIKETIDQSRLVIALIGNGWEGRRDDTTARINETDDFVRVEIAYALARGVPVIPVLVGRVAMPKPHELPEDIRALAFRNAATMDPGVDFHHHVDKLIRGLNRATRLIPEAAAEGSGRLQFLAAPSLLPNEPNGSSQQASRLVTRRFVAYATVLIILVAAAAVIWRFQSRRLIMSGAATVPSQPASSAAKINDLATGSVIVGSHSDGLPFVLTDASGKNKRGKTPATLTGVSPGSARIFFGTAGLDGAHSPLDVSAGGSVVVVSPRYQVNPAERALIGRWRLWRAAGTKSGAGSITFRIGEDGRLLADGDFKLKGNVETKDGKLHTGESYECWGRVEGVQSPDTSAGGTADGHYACEFSSADGKKYSKMALVGEFHWRLYPGREGKKKGQIPLKKSTDQAEFSLPTGNQAFSIWPPPASSVSLPSSAHPTFEKL